MLLLEKFNKKNIITDDTGKYNLLYDKRTNFILNLGIKLLPDVIYRLLALFGVYVWDFIKYKEMNIDSKKKNIFIHGYWQSEKYFYDIQNELKKELIIKEKISIKNEEIYNQIKETSSVCVHIRRGDFLLQSNNLYICENDYYLKAMEKIKNQIKNPHFFIFSDDIEDVKNNFYFADYKVIFVENQNTDFEELQLMCSCKHFIIANSTFSWWASYLSTNLDKLIVAPKMWYTDGRDISDLMRDEWIII